MNSQTIPVLKRVQSDMVELRSQNMYLSGRLRMFDDMMLLLRTRVPESNNGCISNGYDLPGLIENLEKEQEEYLSKVKSDTDRPTEKKIPDPGFRP